MGDGVDQVEEGHISVEDVSKEGPLKAQVLPSLAASPGAAASFSHLAQERQQLPGALWPPLAERGLDLVEPSHSELEGRGRSRSPPGPRSQPRPGQPSQPAQSRPHGVSGSGAESTGGRTVCAPPPGPPLVAPPPSTPAPPRPDPKAERPPYPAPELGQWVPRFGRVSLEEALPASLLALELCPEGLEPPRETRAPPGRGGFWHLSTLWPQC
ncbi:hypothetical protein H8959_006841 [Pygathrix nigripes]